MGGHTQFGAFNELDEAVIFWINCKKEYEFEKGLFLVCGEIKYDGTSYKLAMRFSK